MFKTNFKGKENFERAMSRLFGKLIEVAELDLLRAVQNIRDEMREEGKPIVYPVQWDSTKQRKAFFATNGFGRGIPTKRTGASVNAWKAIAIQDGAQVSNPLAHIVYLSGQSIFAGSRRQSRIHEGRWKLFNVVAKAIISRLPQSIRSRLIQSVSEQGFVAK